MKLEVRMAQPDEAELLTCLAVRSKQSNGYDDVFMTACRDELTVTPERIQDEEYWVAETDTICGFFCLDIDYDTALCEVPFFYVEPNWKRKGVGSMLWKKVVERARVHGMRILCLDADPIAVPFYEKLGLKVVCEVPSGSIKGRSLPRMTISLTSIAQ